MGHIKGLDSLEEYLEEAIRNIRHDRTIISTLLMDLMVHIKKDDQKKFLYIIFSGEISEEIKTISFNVFMKFIEDLVGV